MRRGKFGFVFDVDGVLLRGGKVIARSNDAIKLVKDLNIPLAILTNGGGESEDVFAKKLHKSGIVDVSEHEIVLAHTPTKSMVSDYKDELCVVFGRKDPVLAAGRYGFKAVSPEDYLSVFDSFPFERYKCRLSEEMVKMIREKPVALSMVYSDPLLWGRDIELLCDLSRDSTDGALPSRNGKKMKTLFCNSDLFWSHSFPLPRLGQGAFHVALKAVYREIFGEEFEYETMGKPHSKTYDYVSSLLNVEDRIYCIGDNLHSDILGANLNSHISVLVRSGLHKEGTPGDFYVFFFCWFLLIFL